MKLLLDTHAILWYATSDPRLSTIAAALIKDENNSIQCSPASFWEMAIKVSNRKLTLVCPYADFLKLCLTVYGFDVLPIEFTLTTQLAALPYPTRHKDPFDRLLIAQAIVEGIPILSADAAFDACPVRRIW